MILKNITTRRQQNGFTLMEAMVALLIFSVGLLGMAAMQLSGLQNNHKALMRTHAVQQIYDMADQLRSDAFADIDKDQWNAILGQRLASGQGTVEQIELGGVGGPTAFDITIFWDEDRTMAQGKDCSADYQKDLRCSKIIIVP